MMSQSLLLRWGMQWTTGAMLTLVSEMDPESDHSDPALIAAVASGDHAACARLVRRHSRVIAAYAYRMLGSESEAQDITQETFLRVWTHAGRWDFSKGSVSTWLHRIAHNLCVDRMRRSRTDALDDPDSLVADQQANADILLERQELVQRIQYALSTLPERQRSALILTHYQGLSNKEVAVILDISVDAVESLLSRARRALKAQLQVTQSGAGAQ